ncbi:conserved hypothetical protein [Candidatus Accumulibacter aalborgensis]|uniref:Uncharacterized protein n=1 Tax=Candidatus Accumulibacter aalborgensis TaxID=1860102 RepID=A0A1A8XZT8_9PROT|nr:conserved hypothetical protein [Candidatus Accumulibacter aalborgensis]
MPMALRLDDAHDVFLAHDQQLVAIDLDGLASVLAEQDAVTHLDGEGTNSAVFEHLAIADGADFALIGLFSGGIGDDNTGCGLALFFKTFNDHAIMQRANLHAVSPWLKQISEHYGQVQPTSIRDFGRALLALKANEC